MEGDFLYKWLTKKPKTKKVILVFFSGFIFIYCSIYLLYSYLTHSEYRGQELHLIPLLIIGLTSMLVFIFSMISLIKQKRRNKFEN